MQHRHHSSLTTALYFFPSIPWLNFSVVVICTTFYFVDRNLFSLTLLSISTSSQSVAENFVHILRCCLHSNLFAGPDTTVTLSMLYWLRCSKLSQSPQSSNTTHWNENIYNGKTIDRWELIVVQVQPSLRWWQCSTVYDWQSRVETRVYSLPTAMPSAKHSKFMINAKHDKFTIDATAKAQRVIFQLSTGGVA